MFVGYLITGFMLGFIIGVAGGYKLAKRSEAQGIQHGANDVEQDYHASVPTNWRDE